MIQSNHAGRRKKRGELQRVETKGDDTEGGKPKAIGDSGSRGPLNYFLMPARRVFSKVRWDTMPRDMPRDKGLRIEEDGLLGAAASSSCEALGGSDGSGASDGGGESDGGAASGAARNEAARPKMLRAEARTAGITCAMREGLRG